MATGRNNGKAFRRHLEDMKTFRQAHQPCQKASIPGKETNGVEGGQPFNKVTSLMDDRGKMILVPLWEFEPPYGLQN